MARHEDLALLQKMMVRARFDEPIWGDARRSSMKGAFIHMREGAGEPAADHRAD